MDWAEIWSGFYRHIVLHCIKVSGQSEFKTATQHRPETAVQVLLSGSFWLVDILYEMDSLSNDIGILCSNGAANTRFS